ncbi:hypothetical protein ACHAWO_014002 [Cyclotella atomus]|uniref:Glutamine--fructose-6-phosphate aminotransferase [isomerizing] n=1 Tax=Cyclotella atomus TaxID=382360 RepID=A0ABD3QDZ8_9STRA
MLLSTAFRRLPRAATANAAKAFASTSASNASDNHHAGMLALLAAGAASAAFVGNEKADCTAIAAVVGKEDFDARKFLLDGLEKIKTRGYDGAGIATMSPQQRQMVVVKKSSPDDNVDPIKMVRESSTPLPHHTIGIAHTRWATVGSITDKNAHPHTDASGKIAVVHNGSILNKEMLRKELKGLGYKFEGQTDTEVIAKLIGHYHEKGDNVRDATEKAMKRCDGTWGLVVMCSDNPEELIVTSHGSPLYIGRGDGGTFVASSVSAFKGYSRHFIKLEDMEVATLTVDGRNLDLSKQIKPDEEEEVASPSPYPHWYIKEVMEQPQAIGRALGFGGRLSFDTATLGGLDEQYDKLKDIDSISLVGCGSSYNAALYGAKLLRHTGAFTAVSAMDANSADEYDFRFLGDPSQQGIIFISQSGETREMIDCMHQAVKRNFPTIGVVNSVGSTIADMVSCGTYTFAGDEKAAPSTKSFTNEVICLALISLWFRQVKAKEHGMKLPPQADSLGEALQRMPITFGMALRTQSACKKAAKKLAGKEHCFVLGKGFGEPIAMEGALKFKEIGYLHAEGYSGGALKHGPFAMIESDENGKNGATPIVMLVLDDNHAHHMRTACEEVKARGAELIIITDNKKLADGLDDNPIIIPSNGPLTALGAIVPLQLIAYELAMLKENNPDTPRNLLKSFV